jgi:serine/threonine-protein kinase HipA
VKTLNIWLEGEDGPIGQLSSDDYGAMSFTYTLDWAMRGHPISLSLPLTPVAQPDSATRAFFNNLLHENDQLRQLLQREGLERDNIVGILEHLGADCAGAISCLPLDAPPVKRPGNLETDYDGLDEPEVVDIVKRLAAGQALPDVLRDPSPVAGYRRKISIALLPDGRFALPKPGLGVPTTHILKIPDAGHKDEELQEAAAAQLARDCGFDASISVADVIADQPLILIQRFDRLVTANGQVTRVHQEDFTQALGLPDDLKYERRAQGSRKFDAAAIAWVLNQTENPAAARLQFLRTTLFNLMIGNTDNHAKNHALLYGDSGRPRLAPLYDMVPIPLGRGYTDAFSYTIGTAKRAVDLKADDLASFARTLGFAEGRALVVVRETCVSLANALERASHRLLPDLRTFDMLIGREMARLADLLDVDLELRERDYLPGPDEKSGWETS